MLPDLPEGAIAQLRKWTEKETPIEARFVGKGLTFNVIGRVFVSDEKSEVWLLTKRSDGKPQIALSLSLLVAVACESYQPLRDAPNELKLEFDFFADEAFKLPYGHVDFREMGGNA